MHGGSQMEKTNKSGMSKGSKKGGKKKSKEPAKKATTGGEGEDPGRQWLWWVCRRF